MALYYRLNADTYGYDILDDEFRVVAEAGTEEEAIKYIKENK